MIEIELDKDKALKSIAECFQGVDYEKFAEHPVYGNIPYKGTLESIEPEPDSFRIKFLKDRIFGEFEASASTSVDGYGQSSHDQIAEL